MSAQLPDRFGHVKLASENAIPDVANPQTIQNQDPFWHTVEIDELRWDQSFPFQLLYLKHDGSGRYSRVPRGTFTLPIPPQALQKSHPFAINMGVTLGGIVEEHNGIPVRPIVLQGTTGVLPGRPTGQGVAQFNAAESIFAGTVRATSNLSSTATQLSPGAGFRPNTITDDEIQSTLKGTTGYYQFLLLKQFLEAYANLKKTAAGQEYRLAFAHWKTGEVYLVTPTDFSVVQNVSSPLEYTYTLAMKAWKRISLDKPETAVTVAVPVIRRPGGLQTLLTNLDTARRSLAKLKDVISAVGQDVDNVVFEPLRSLSLMAKEMLGVTATAADLPVNIVRSMKSAILEAAGISAAVNQVGNSVNNLGSRIGGELTDLGKQLEQFAVATSKAQTGSGALSTAGLTAQNPDPANKILENPQDYYELFEKVNPGSLKLSPALQRKINDEKTRVKTLKRLDFEQYRDALVDLLDDFTDFVGAGHATYSRIKGRAAPTSTRTPTDDDYEVIFHLNAAIQELNRLVASSSNESQTAVDVIDYVAGLAGRSGIRFEIPKSKLMVPLPYGFTIEQVAAKYLGDAERWIEIATLNRLREPYIDEDGFDMPLLVNGVNNQVTVSSAENLFVGQPVWVSSTTVPAVKRRITSIDKVGDQYVILTLDGDADLDQFLVSAAAKLHAYLPDTANSGMLIAIPSDQEPDSEDFDGKSLPDINEYDSMLRVGGVDLMLTSDGDAAITDDGDWKLAYGLTNLVQFVRVFAGTVRGSMIYHPKFGLAVEPGTSTADVSAQDLLNSLQDLFEFNPAFTGIKSASIYKQGPLLKMQASLEIAGTKQLLPVTVDVKT